MMATVSNDDSNRVFTQAFLARTTMTFETAKPLLAAIFSVHEGKEVLVEDVTMDDFISYISAANISLSAFDYEIRSTFHQRTRDRVWALVNTTNDPLTQLATTYSADEIAYVKKLLDAMFDGPANKGRKEAMCLSSIEALQVGRGGNRRETQNGAGQPSHHNLTVKEAEETLKKLIQEGWLEKSQAGFHTLTPRALMELKGWLIDTYNEPSDDEDGEEIQPDKIKFCHACKEIITMGQRCAKRECVCRLHDICTQNFFRARRSKDCPLCKTAWDGKSYVGERAITKSESYQKGRRRSSNRQSVEEDQDEEEMEEEGG